MVTEEDIWYVWIDIRRKYLLTFGVWIGVVCVEVSGVVKENIEALEPLV